jgi:primosomal protein N' (replication factor Y)
MQYAEVVVNVPIRRTFSPRFSEAPPADYDPFAASVAGAEAPRDDEDVAFQTFHYHLPPELEHRLAPGHLVWVPFGAREVQGFVLNLCDASPVPTKPIKRLARPEPVLTPAQLELARWIAHTYVAPLAEAVKLFLPPGLMEKEAGAGAVHAKRELQISWAGGAVTAAAALDRLGRDTHGSRMMAYLLGQPGGATTLPALQEAVALSSTPAAKTALKGLAAKGLVRVADDQVQLAVDPAAARRALYELRGVDKYLPILEVLCAADAPLWKSELYAQVDANLATLRALQEAGLVELNEVVRFRDPLAGRTYARTQAPPLTSEQALVWETIRAEGLARRPGPRESPGSQTAAKFLIHGVTGSGKTEIYLRAIADTLALGRQAIVLVPEIALTPQTVARFAGRFPNRVTVIHSGLSAGERYDVWRKLREGEFDVVVGPRSALFAPLARLGLIVLDEEHEPSYKQDAEVWGSFKAMYDARRVASKLAELVGGVLIYGSATPSLEAYYAAEQGELTLLSMPHRVVGHDTGAGLSLRSTGALSGVEPVLYAELPPVEIVDMRLELRAGNRSILSRTLLGELHETLDAGEQAILFLNRRGTSTFVNCRDCGHVERCLRCDVPLTYHERASVLVCHHCNRRYPIPSICPVCSSKRIRYFGAGTQRIEELVQQIAPRARLLRWDGDTTAGKGSHEAILRQFAAHEADVLVGTQMIAKGLDLPLVTLVGVISADVGLYLPDFRSGERTFQLLTQVAGRAGRSRRGGRVVIQTYTPDHYVVQAAARHDYGAFYRRELAYRRELGYPPLRRMARLVYWDKRQVKAQETAENMAVLVAARLEELGPGVEATLVGPAPAFFARYRGFYRWQIMLIMEDPAAVLRSMNIPFGWRVDVDPVSVL